MRNRNWHILREEGDLGPVITLSRERPARLDVVAETDLPPGDPIRLAHQIRQDMWRVLQSMRGFSPVVRLTATTAGWRVAAGGRVLGKIPPATAGQIQALLENQSKRSRWVAQANRRGGQN